MDVACSFENFWFRVLFFVYLMNFENLCVLRCNCVKLELWFPNVRDFCSEILARSGRFNV